VAIAIAILMSPHHQLLASPNVMRPVGSSCCGNHRLVCLRLREHLFSGIEASRSIETEPRRGIAAYVAPVAFV
jgi:hypothetical protein